MQSTNRTVRIAMNASTGRTADAANMSAQQAVTLVEMEIGLPDSDAENLLAQYGWLIRRELGDRVYKDLYERAVANSRERRR